MATQRATILVALGPSSYALCVDIVPGDLPLLISRQDQIAMRGVTDAGRGLFSVMVPAGEMLDRLINIPLIEVPTGHWLLPLGY